MDAAAIRVVIPRLETDNSTLNEAFRIAIGDLLGNVSLFQDGLLEHRLPTILAGLHYDTPWTRDAAINSWNGSSLMMPDAARNTLLSVLTRSGDRIRIGGQYWDAMIWATGAWNHYLYTGDRQFLLCAFDATSNSLERLEVEEFDAKTGLFRGPGWSDGVAGYPDEYADASGSSSILDWPKHNPNKVSKPGYGIPMQALSTNCIYYNAYVIAEKMKAELKNELKDSGATVGRKGCQAEEGDQRKLLERRKGQLSIPGRSVGQVRSSGRARLGLRDLIRCCGCPANRGDLQEPTHHPCWYSLRVAQFQTLQKQGRNVVRPAHRHRLAADSGLLG